MQQPASPSIDGWLEKAWPDARQFAGVRLSRDELLKLAWIVARAVKKHPTVSEVSAIVGSTSHLLGHEVSDKLLKRNLLRVLANWHFIHDGQEVPLWDGRKATSEVVFVGVAKAPQKPGRLPDYIVKAKLKTGLGAGIIKCGLLSQSRIEMFLEHLSGCFKWKCDAPEISGMQATVDVMLESDGSFSFCGWKCNDRQKRHNRALTEKRSDPFRCGAGLPCSLCTKTITECPLAVWLPAPKKEDKRGES